MDLSQLLNADERPPTQVLLPLSGRVVNIRTLLRAEIRADEQVPRCRSCWAPNKPGLTFEGKTTFAELVIVRLLERAGWDARWVRNWTGGRQLCIDVDQQRALPAAAAQVFAALHQRVTELRGAGSWDVFAWSGDDYLFIESRKHRSSDRPNANQIVWLEAAIDEGFSSQQFAIVEYDAGQPTREVESRAPRAARTRASAPPRELIDLLVRVRAVDRTERIDSRNAIADFGVAAIQPMVEWLQEDELRRFAIAVLGAIGRTERKAVVELRGYAETGGPDSHLAAATVDRLATTRRSGSP